MEIRLGETSFHLDEKDVAECEGGQGQLPFPVLPGERVPFLDLSQGEQFATIEFNLEDNTARVFHGRRLETQAMHLDTTAEEAGVGADPLAAERAAGEGKRERVVRRDDRSPGYKVLQLRRSARDSQRLGDVNDVHLLCANLDLTLRRVDCPNCSSTIAVKGGHETKSTVCTHCDSLINISRDEPTLIRAIMMEHRPQIPFELGHQCTFDGIEYTLIGHHRIMTRDAWGIYRSDEFMLYNEEHGHRWLTRENGHYSLSVELDERPIGFNPRIAQPKQKFSFLGKSWTVFERDEYSVEWVDGELPWVAQVGDKSHYLDAIHPAAPSFRRVDGDGTGVVLCPVCDDGRGGRGLPYAGGLPDAADRRRAESAGAGRPPLALPPPPFCSYSPCCLRSVAPLPGHGPAIRWVRSRSPPMRTRTST